MIWLLISLLFPASVFAQTVTITPTPTPNTSQEIQKLREVVSQKVAEKLRQIANPASSKRAFIAKIIQIDSTSLAVEYQNNPRSVNLAADTAYVDAKGNKIKLTSLKVGQDILVMGSTPAGTSIFEAKRIVLTDAAAITLRRTVVVGKIVDVSRTSPIFSLIPSKNKNDLYQIKTDTKTEILDSKSQKIKVSDLKSGQRIIAVLRPDVKISKTYSAISLVDLDYTPAVSPTPTKKP